MGLLDTLLGHAGETDIAGLHDEFGSLLAQGEALQRAFGFVRDLIVFTDRRMIIVDKQGVTGRKTSYLSIPYRAIVMYSIETAGHFDLDSDLKIWVSSQPEPITRALGRGAGARDIIAILAQATR
jgi:hypothetical protein